MPSQTNLDFEASKRCIQAGTVSLLLAVAGLVLAQYWGRSRATAALGKYINARNELAQAVADLKSDPYWLRYVDTHEAARESSISALQRIALPMTSSGPGAKAALKSVYAMPHGAKRAAVQLRWASPKTQHRGARLLTPTNFSVTVSERPAGVREIAHALQSLNDPPMLEGAMQASDFFAYSIMRWGDRRGHLIYANYAAGTCKPHRIEIPTPRHGGEFVPLMDPKAVLGCLTLGDVETLASFNFPSFGNPLNASDHLAPRVGLSLSLLDASLPLATALIDLAILLTLTFFWAYTAEAVLLPGFPASCTLYGSLGRHRLSALLLAIALWAPAFSCLLGAWESHLWWVSAASVLPVIPTLATYRTLHRAGLPVGLWPGRSKRAATAA